MDMLLNVGLILAGLAGLFYGGNWLVDSSSLIAKRFGVPTIIIGLTIVAVGTSAPELVVSVLAASRGASGIALGNVVGSNIANVGFILGMIGLLTPIAVAGSLVRREIPFLVAISFLAYGLMFDQTMSRLDGMILVSLFIAFTGFLIYVTMRGQTTHHAQHLIEPQESHSESTPSVEINIALQFGKLAVGIAVLIVGAQLTVQGATTIATALGVPEAIIGLTLVAVGTSLPELAASMVSAFRGESDLAVGNVVGSNIANILLILGVSSIVSPIPAASSGTLAGTFIPYVKGMLTFDFLIMIAFALLMLPFSLDRQLTRREAGMFLIAYIGFIVASFAL